MPRKPGKTAPRFSRESLSTMTRVFRHWARLTLDRLWALWLAGFEWLLPGSIRRSLFGKLSVLLLVGTILVYLVAVGGLWWIASNIVDDSLRKQANQWVAEFDELGTPLYVSRKGKALLDMDKHIKNFPEIVFVRYYDTTGKKILAEFGRVKDPVVAPLDGDYLQRLTTALAATQQAHLFLDNEDVAGDYARILAPVRIRSIANDGLFDFSLDGQRETVKVIGFIEFGMDHRYYRGQFLRYVALGSVVIAIVFLFCLIAGRQLIRKALAPLTDLQTPLARLANGETNVSVESNGDTEIAVISDALNTTIRALKERDDTLRRLAEYDALTGLPNRVYFCKQVEKEVELFAREDTPSAILFIDLDRFKYVNDALGHAAGDRLLVQVAGLLKERLREQDICARFGGDEFTVLARRAGRQGAEEIARSINAIMKDYCFIEGGKKFNVYCSIGITMIDSDRFAGEEFVTQADIACYAAKARGRNRYHFYDANAKDMRSRETDIGWAQRIKDVVRENRLQLYYQPIVSTSGGDREMYEVLLRMPGKNGTPILPEVFFPVAERFGLLVDIDHWVIAHAMGALAGYRAAGRDLAFSINLSGQVFEDLSFADMIKEHLLRNQLPPSSIIFEITEQVAVRYMDRASGIMQSLSELGCRFALDDFGVGFSSFNYLKHLPVEFIKIDGSFVTQLHKNPIDQAMVRAIIEIARVLGKKTVIESVQDRKSMRLVKAYGADYLQGRYIGEPLDMPEQPPLRSAVG